MRLREVWRATSFRLAILYGALFALLTVALLGAVYVQSTDYLTRRVDRILYSHALAMSRVAAADLPRRIGEALALNADQTNVYGLFTPQGGWITGNLVRAPPALTIGGPAIEAPPTPLFPSHARLIARRLPSGEILVVGRDVSQLREMRVIIASALVWSGASTLVFGLAFGVALSVRPLRRLRRLEATARLIAGGDLKQRLPVGQAHDELDTLAGAVNRMVDDVQRLMSEVKSSTDTIAHDLRTPLTRARARLHRLRQAGQWRDDDIVRVTEELDEVLDRFRAILRLSEIEARDRRVGFSTIDLGDIILKASELYGPLAEANGVNLSAEVRTEARVDADGRLLFEAVSNLVDNAIKFSDRNGRVRLLADLEAGAPRIVVEDNGPGIPAQERSAVTQRFYRREKDRAVAGAGLGLSVVSAIVRLHGFELILEDARPGLRAIIRCGAAADRKSQGVIAR